MKDEKDNGSEKEKPLRILHLEDSALDAEIIREGLISAGFSMEMDLASNRQEFTTFLQRGGYDLVLADYQLPGFDAPAALAMVKSLHPGLPCIVVSGAIGEEKAVELLKQGATDYVLKDRLTKLPVVIERAMEEVREHRARQAAEESLLRLNRELRAISNCNQTLMRAEDEQTLLSDICNIICIEAGYRMAWVGYAENDEAKTVRPVAWAGVEEGYLAQATITWADTERGRGPSGTAIRSGKSATIQDFSTDPLAAPWRENALKRGYRSSIAMPLKDESSNTFGILTLYSTEPNAFSSDEIRLLEELAGDLAFGITTLRTRARRKQAEEELRELNETLEQRVRDELALSREKDHILIQQSRLAALGEMVHNIAHQWRQPLTVISLILNNIQDDYDFNELTRGSLESSVTQAQTLIQSMSRIIDNFTEFFRPDREPGDFDVREAIEDALLVTDAALKDDHIDVQRNMESGLKAFGYSNQFGQVLLNVLTNAREALHSHGIHGGRIELTLSRVDDRCMLTVRDNGGGIREEILPRIFDPYFSTKFQGSGIGLYMSKMIVERNLNGTIQAGNSGDGAIITITLPLLPEKERA